MPLPLATETYSKHYAVSYPGEERESARGIRLRPLYGRLKKLGAVFGEKGGWERLNWIKSNEPLLDGDRVLGRVTSAGYGYTVGQSIAYGYLPVEYAAPGTNVEVELSGERLKASVAKEPLYDARGEKIRE